MPGYEYIEEYIETPEFQEWMKRQGATILIGIRSRRGDGTWQVQIDGPGWFAPQWRDIPWEYVPIIIHRHGHRFRVTVIERTGRHVRVRFASAPTGTEQWASNGILVFTHGEWETFRGINQDRMDIRESQP